MALKRMPACLRLSMTTGINDYNQEALSRAVADNSEEDEVKETAQLCNVKSWAECCCHSQGQKNSSEYP